LVERRAFKDLNMLAFATLWSGVRAPLAEFFFFNLSEFIEDSKKFEAVKKCLNSKCMSAFASSAFLIL